MQIGQQVLWSDQKKMEDVQRVREAIRRGESVLTECQVDFIRRHTEKLGEDGEMVMNKIQERAGEPGCQPADIVRMIEDYCEDLGNRAMLRELSIDLEKEKMAQLGAMETEVSKLKLANKQEDC